MDECNTTNAPQLLPFWGFIFWENITIFFYDKTNIHYKLFYKDKLKLKIFLTTHNLNSKYMHLRKSNHNHILEIKTFQTIILSEERCIKIK